MLPFMLVIPRCCPAVCRVRAEAGGSCWCSRVRETKKGEAQRRKKPQVLWTLTCVFFPISLHGFLPATPLQVNAAQLQAMMGGVNVVPGQALHPIPHNDCVVDGVGVDKNAPCKMWGW